MLYWQSLISWWWARRCSKHVEDSNGRIIEWRNCASSWLFANVILRCTVSKTSKNSKIVSTSSLLIMILMPSALFFFSKSLFTKCSYGKNFLGLTAASDGSSIRRFGDEILHHPRSFGIIHVNVLWPCCLWVAFCETSVCSKRLKGL